MAVVGGRGHFHLHFPGLDLKPIVSPSHTNAKLSLSLVFIADCSEIYVLQHVLNVYFVS